MKDLESRLEYWTLNIVVKELNSRYEPTTNLKIIEIM